MAQRARRPASCGDRRQGRRRRSGTTLRHGSTHRRRSRRNARRAVAWDTVRRPRGGARRFVAPERRSPGAPSDRQTARGTAETDMIRTFRRLFESTLATAARATEAEEREHGYHVATAALLVEMMRADSRGRARGARSGPPGAGRSVRRPRAGRDTGAARARRGAGRRRHLPVRVHAGRQPAVRPRAEGARRGAACGGSPGPTAPSTSTRSTWCAGSRTLIHVPHSVFIRMKHRAEDGAPRPVQPRTPEDGASG